MTTEINAAATVSALVHSQRFDLSSTYFMVAGIGGVNPEVATICAVTFARYAIQVAMQYEIDPRELNERIETIIDRLRIAVPGSILDSPRA